MTKFDANIAPEVVAAAQAGAGEAAEALSRALDAPQVELTVGEAATVNLKHPPDGFDGPGLAIVLAVAPDAAAVVVLPETSGLLPSWVSAPDATGESKLATLAQELGMLLLPEVFMPADFRAGAVSAIDQALIRAEPADEAAFVPMALTAGDARGTLSLIWPVAKPDAVFEAGPSEVAAQSPAPQPELEPQPAAAEPPAPPVPAMPPIASSPAPRTVGDDLTVLPSYSRSLLRVKVPVRVTLAEKRQTVQSIIELGAGSIIRFEKACEEMLDLSVGDEKIAVGEAVKVGEKFGLRITSLVLPGERFRPIGKS